MLERLKVYPQLCTTRLLREIRERYDGGYTILGDYLRTVRPVAEVNFEIRYETPPGQQAQVDFAMFQTHFKSDPKCCGASGCLPWFWVTVVACGGFLRQSKPAHRCACICVPLKRFWGAPREVLYDRMKTAVIGENPNGEVIYNQTLSSMLHHYGAVPRACPAYRPQTKGKVERVFRYVRQSFFTGSSFENLAHLNECFAKWQDEVAKRWHHAMLCQ